MGAMAVSFTFPGLHCPRMNTYVSLDQTEAECRERHNCEKAGRCPLEEELGHTSLERTIAQLAEEARKGNPSTS
jgi:hypothetical protein